jgi:hypothetical protein
MVNQYSPQAVGWLHILKGYETSPEFKRYSLGGTNEKR